MFHHLPNAEKDTTPPAVRRVLKREGTFHMLDFEGPQGGTHGVLWHRFAQKRLKENSESQVFSLMRQVGFSDPRKADEKETPFGRMAYFRART